MQVETIKGKKIKEKLKNIDNEEVYAYKLLVLEKRTLKNLHKENIMLSIFNNDQKEIYLNNNKVSSVKIEKEKKDIKQNK